MRGRKKPYTESEIRKAKCVRCGQPAREQWAICSLDGRWHPICIACDVALNELVLEFINHPRKEIILQAYTEKKLGFIASP